VEENKNNSMNTDPPLLETRELVKQFPMVIAVNKVDFDIHKGEIHCLLGENGAGKSTLAECIYGFYTPSQGEILWKGNPVNIASPAEAMKLGIGMVHQHFMLIETHTVLDNILLGRKTPGPLLDKKAARARISELCTEYDIQLNPDALIQQLSVGEQQWIEILKALYDGVELLILDEPTAVLTPQESERLFSVLKKMSRDGLSIILITHKLNEVMQVSDRVTVLRKGSKIGTVNTREITKIDLACMMVGREVIFSVEKEKIEPGNPLLELRDVHAENDIGVESVRGINLTLHESEILGIAGVAGNGQKELFEVIIGVRNTRSGCIYFKNKPIFNTDAGEVHSNGIAHIPADRIKEGLVMEFSIAENMILGLEWTKPYRKGVQIDKKVLTSFAHLGMKAYDIAASSIYAETGKLSGGNLQKILLAREIGSKPSVLVANQPCRGLDVGVIEYVHRQLLKLRSEGVGILLFSEDLDEIFTLSDRIAVIYRGQILDVIDREKAELLKIGMLMAGAKDEPVD
jgi:simple sugar transport system ATP-binding protein